MIKSYGESYEALLKSHWLVGSKVSVIDKRGKRWDGVISFCQYNDRNEKIEVVFKSNYETRLSKSLIKRLFQTPNK